MFGHRQAFVDEKIRNLKQIRATQKKALTRESQRGG
jgi:hypothetical protein